MTKDIKRNDEPRFADLTTEFMFQLDAFMSEKAVMKVTTLSRTSLYRKRVAGEFPEPEPISEGRVGYRVRDVYQWLQDPRAWPNP